MPDVLRWLWLTILLAGWRLYGWVLRHKVGLRQGVNVLTLVTVALGMWLNHATRLQQVEIIERVETMRAQRNLAVEQMVHARENMEEALRQREVVLADREAMMSTLKAAVMALDRCRRGEGKEQL